MNAPDRSLHTGAGGANLACLQLHCSDETTESYVVHNAVACGSSLSEVTAALFGSQINLTRPLHGGFGQLQKVLGSRGYWMPRGVVEEMSLLALYRPFLSPNRYQLARDTLLGRAGKTRIGVVLGNPGGVIKDQPAHCPACMLEDVRRVGYAPKLRSHQIRGVQICHLHDCALLHGCPHCGANFLRTGLTLASCHSCGRAYGSHGEPCTGSLPRAWRSYAHAVAAVFRGDIPAAVDQMWFVEQVADQIRSKSGLVGHNLATTLVGAYGEQHLHALGRSPNAPPTFAWPALFLQGGALVGDPLAGLLLIAVLAPESDWSRLPTCPAKDWHFDGLGPNEDIATEANSAVLRDLYRCRSIADVAAKHRISNGRLKRWVAAFPGLPDRLARFSVASAKRLLLREAREMPGITRSGVELRQRAAFRLVSLSHPTWLDAVFPSRRASKQVRQSVNAVTKVTTAPA